MIPLLVTPDLRQPCPVCFPFGGPVFPCSTVTTGTTLRARYRCPCGYEWPCWWCAGDPWPLASGPQISLDTEIQLKRRILMPDTRNWRKPRRSMNNGNCLEAANTPGRVAVRDTADRDGTVLTFGTDAWAAFTATVKAGAR